VEKIQKIIFMGTSEFAVPALKALQTVGHEVALVVTQPDRPAGRGLELKASAVKNQALAFGMEVFQPEKIKSPEAIETLRKIQPDFMIVAAYGQILTPAVLQMPKTACLNIHGSILPKYRGAAPIHYAVMEGEKETGVTLMYMNEKMDEGDILLVKKTPIGGEETTGEVHDRLARMGAEGLLEALEMLNQGNAPRVPQDPGQATYAHSLKREQGRLIWSKSAREIVNQVRGLCPWPVAETQWRDMNLRVHSSKNLEQPSGNGKAGEILEITKEGVRVAAPNGSGSVLITEIQPPGKKKMGAYDFTLGHPDFKPGEILS
jgi:methionyl-tRNA formyltransferase